MKNFYLERFALRPPIILEDVSNDTSLIIVVPCYNEYNLIESLVSLKNCDPPIGRVEVIVIINAAEDADPIIIEQNKNTFIQSSVWAKENSNQKLKFFILVENKLPPKDAGVGLARKIGMDEAVYRFAKIKNPNGVIVCFDADCLCSKNYFIEIEKAFLENLKATAASIKFEHNFDPTIYNHEIINGIILYELHLRYYIEALRYSKFPYAFHTIGSSMAVRNSVYQKQGGMNKKKAGEDFYFLQKIIPLGNFIEINSTIVFPSPRISDRVPFGTGKAMGVFLSGNGKIYYSYNFLSFKVLKIFFENVSKFYDEEWNQEKCESFFDRPLLNFLESVFLVEKINEFKRNTANYKTFESRFYNWFNAFMVLKFTHFMRDNKYENINVVVAVNLLLSEIEDFKNTTITNPLDLLTKLRQIQ